MERFPSMSEAARLTKLQPPAPPVRVVVDTDTYNEIDDQFALVHALLSPAQIEVQAIYAAPFHNVRSGGPGDGMEKSYQEIERLLDRLDGIVRPPVCRGATAYLSSDLHPVMSEAVSDLVQRTSTGVSNEAAQDNPLYVVAIGAATNVASAILANPQIIEHIVVVWLGGHALHWPHNHEFNLKQDPVAARLLFDCGVPLVHVPCLGVSSHLSTTVPEIEQYVRDCGAIGDYLANIFADLRLAETSWSKVIWDMAAIAYLIEPELVPTDLVHSPLLTDQFTWSVDRSRHFIRSAWRVHRDPIFRDLFAKLEAFSQK